MSWEIYFAISNKWHCVHLQKSFLCQKFPWTPQSLYWGPATSLCISYSDNILITKLMHNSVPTLYINMFIWVYMWTLLIVLCLAKKKKKKTQDQRVVFAVQTHPSNICNSIFRAPMTEQTGGIFNTWLLWEAQKKKPLGETWHFV